MNIVHFMSVPFTGLGTNGGYRGDEWLKNRILVFKRFVLPALMSQTKREFIVWFQWRREEKDNRIVTDFVRTLKRYRGLETVHTFGGICIYDDKYPDALARERLLRSLAESLPVLQRYVTKDTDRVLVTCQPSDDAYHVDAVKEIQEAARELSTRAAICYVKGYIMNYATKEAANYDPATLPPFSTIPYIPETFLDPQKHFAHIGPYKSHENVKDHFLVHEMEGRGFMVGTHGENISTTWNVVYRGALLSDDARERVWTRFACWEADPVVIKKRFRLVTRTVINRLPRPVQDAMRWAYHLIRNAYVR